MATKTLERSLVVGASQQEAAFCVELTCSSLAYMGSLSVIPSLLGLIYAHRTEHCDIKAPSLLPNLSVTSKEQGWTWGQPLLAVHNLLCNACSQEESLPKRVPLKASECEIDHHYFHTDHAWHWLSSWVLAVICCYPYRKNVLSININNINMNSSPHVSYNYSIYRVSLSVSLPLKYYSVSLLPTVEACNILLLYGGTRIVKVSNVSSCNHCR